MASLDAAAIRQFVDGDTTNRLAELEVFAEIESTNSYLMQEPGPAPGMIRVAVTNNQIAGRGRHGKTWESPPGSGICLSVAYTFASRPDNPSALTLAIGLAAIAALEELGIENVQLKWPNDLIANDCKLAGILTEVQAQSGAAMTVVSGIGVNLDLPATLQFSSEKNWAKQIVDLRALCSVLPQHELFAGLLISHMCGAFVTFERDGFKHFADQWASRDWLLGRQFSVEIADRKISGTGAGIAEDGALLVDTPNVGVHRITSGSILL